MVSKAELKACVENLEQVLAVLRAAHKMAPEKDAAGKDTHPARMALNHIIDMADRARHDLALLVK